MHSRPFFSPFWLVSIVFFMFAGGNVGAADDAELTSQIESLVADLDSDTIAERDIAETNLLELAKLEEVGAERFLALLPKPNDNMPPAVRQRLTAIRKTVESRLAKKTVEATTITLEAINWPLTEVLKELEKLSGNKIIDGREANGGDVTNPEIILNAQGLPFWSALDQVLDQAKLSPYAYAGEDAISLVARGDDEADRYGRASYAGPFRFEVTEVSASRGLRNPGTQALNLNLEISWEPRLRPIAITQPLDRIDAVTDAGNRLAVGQPGRVYNIEVQEGSTASTITTPFELPDRSINTIETLRGSLTALVPGKREKFTFDNLQPKQPIVQSRGGVNVTLERVVKNGAIWEVHMSLKLDEGNDSLASHRAWVFNNLTYLVGDDGEPIDHAGFETTKQTATEVGIAYLFDVPDGLDGLKWVYESPVSIVEQAYTFELEDIELP